MTPGSDSEISRNEDNRNTWRRDSEAVLDAVMQVCRNGSPVRCSHGSRTVGVDPIADDVSGRVHGVWVQVANRLAPLRDRPSAWAFEWDLTSGVARRSPIVSATQTWAELGVDLSRPIPDGLAKLDLGDATASVLAQLVSGGPGTVLQEVGVECRPSGAHRRMQFTAHFLHDGIGPTGEPHRVVRGVSVDIGPSEGTEHIDRRNAGLDTLVARSLSDPSEYRAIADPDSLQLLYWYGDAPTGIAWQTSHLPGAKPVLHPGDIPDVIRIGQSLKVAQAGAVESAEFRFLTPYSDYVAVSVSARAIDLDDRSRAILVTLRPQVP